MYCYRCGPCRRFAPTYEALAAEYTDVLFLKVCEADSGDAMAARGIQAFPTFHVYLKNARMTEVCIYSGYRNAPAGGIRFSNINTHEQRFYLFFSFLL